MIINEERLILTIPEVGKILGVSRTTAYILANTGQIPVIRLGKKLIVPKSALEKMLAEAGTKSNQE